MGILKSSVDNQYADFNVAVSGGAIGTYRTGLYIDEISQTIFMRFRPIVNFASAGGTGTLSVGFVTSTGISAPTGLAPAVIQPGNLTWIGPDKIFPAWEVTVSIAVEAMTVGRLMIYAQYFNTDL